MQATTKLHMAMSGREAVSEETLAAVVADLYIRGLVLYGRFPKEQSNTGNSAADKWQKK